MVIVGVITQAYLRIALMQAFNLEDSLMVSGNIINQNVSPCWLCTTPLCIDQRIHSLCVAQNVWRIMQETVERGKPEVGRQLLSQVQKVDKQLFQELGVRWNKLMDTLKID